MDEIIALIEETGIPFAYDHFAEGESPDPPFICFLLPGSDNFAADGRAYQKINEVRIELYTDKKDLSVEEQVTIVLDEHGIFYNQTEVWIDSEKLYEVVFSFEVSQKVGKRVFLKRKIRSSSISATCINIHTFPRRYC